MRASTYRFVANLLLTFTSISLILIYGLHFRELRPVETRKTEKEEKGLTFSPVTNTTVNCPKKFGKIVVFVAGVAQSFKTHYGFAQATLKCYLQSHNYEFKLIDLNTDDRVKRRCSQNQLFFRRHCAVMAYLEDADWLFVLDADSGVVNPNHCLEEYIDDNVDIIFYERFFNWEVAAGNYFVKNTLWAREFLSRWANWQYEQPKNWNGADNGVLQLLLLESLLPTSKPEIEMCNKIWLQGTGYDSYMRFVMCCKVALGSRRVWDHIKIFRRGHGWIRDWYMTEDKWCQANFMFHGWKLNNIGDNGWKSPFSRVMNGSDCDSGNAWPWRPEYHISCDNVKSMLKNNEMGAARNFPKVARGLPFLNETDIGDCWPTCEHCC